ncbi:hypothetical protein L9F63_002322, partial [Diploptera punctata]
IVITRVNTSTNIGAATWPEKNQNKTSPNDLFLFAIEFVPIRIGNALTNYVQAIAVQKAYLHNIA